VKIPKFRFYSFKEKTGIFGLQNYIKNIKNKKNKKKITTFVAFSNFIKNHF